MKTSIKIKFDERSADFITRVGYKGAGVYEIDGFEKNGLYYVRASTNYKYLATKTTKTNKIGSLTFE